MIAPVLAPAPAPALAHDLSDRARWTAIEAGERLIYEMTQPPAFDVNFERYPCKNMNGTVGFALAFLALTLLTGDERFERAMHEQFKRAAGAPGSQAGLFDGISGLRAAAALAANTFEPRYRGLVERCDEYVESTLPELPCRPAWYGEYDLISGWSGMRLARCVEGYEEPDRLTQLLEWLIEDDERWACPRTPADGSRCEHNLGMAHGLPGILATLSITLRELPARLRDRIASAARYVVSRARREDGIRAWPRAAEDPLDEGCRAVWCYGAPGVASALLAVAQRIGDGELERYACDVLAECAARSDAALRIGGQGVCHGTAGSALMYFAAARRTNDPAFARACARFTVATIDQLEAAGGRCVTKGYDGNPYDAIGALNGLAGIVLALLTVTGDFDERWLRCHALSTVA